MPLSWHRDWSIMEERSKVRWVFDIGLWRLREKSH
jgi:hypothetical protein